MSKHDGTSTQLIPLTQHDGIQAVLGRDLHKFLEVTTRYNDWFNRMIDYGFVAGQDFYSEMSKTSEQGGRPSINHVLTLDMAKEISMIQRTDKGKQARQYFIECERRAHAPKIDGTELTRRIISNERAGKAAATPSVRGRTTGLRGRGGAAEEGVRGGASYPDQCAGNWGGHGNPWLHGEPYSQSVAGRFCKSVEHDLYLVRTEKAPAVLPTPRGVTEHVGGVQ